MRVGQRGSERAKGGREIELEEIIENENEYIDSTWVDTRMEERKCG